MSAHAAPITAEDVSIVIRLSAVIEELEDIQQCAEDLGWRGVEHKTQEALGRLHNALVTARQYGGERSPECTICGGTAATPGAGHKHQFDNEEGGDISGL